VKGFGDELLEVVTFLPVQGMLEEVKTVRVALLGKIYVGRLMPSIE
jgi:hypothetical protein